METITINDNSHKNTKKTLRKKNRKQYLLYPNYEETAQISRSLRPNGANVFNL